MKFSGIVGKYAHRASVLGFPTVNIPLSESGASGSYVARVFVQGAVHPAAAYADPERGILEAHLLDFSGDLYGKEIEIELLEKIREPEHFESEEALKKAITGDIATARAYFKIH